MNTNLNKINDYIDKKVNELSKIEPFWKICLPCKNNGRCCNGADVNVHDSEWEEIVNLLNSHKDILSYAQGRIKKKSCCIFFNYSASKCLIHSIRPINCRYTPFQIIKNKNNKYVYHSMHDNCNLFLKENPLQIYNTEQKHIVKVKKNQDSEIHLLYLNEMPELLNYGKNENIKKLSERFKAKYI